MDEAAEAEVRHTSTDHRLLTRRWFDADAMRQIDAELRKGPFDEFEWRIDHAGGNLKSARVEPLLDQVPIDRVTGFSADAVQRVWKGQGLSRELETARVDIDASGHWLSWKADPGTDVEGSRLAFQRVIDLIESLPESGLSAKFGTPPPALSRRLHPPETLVGWSTVIGVPIGVVAIVVTILLAR